MRVSLALLAFTVAVSWAQDGTLPDHYPKFLKTGKYGTSFNQNPREFESTKNVKRTNDGRKTFTKTSYTKTGGGGGGGAHPTAGFTGYGSPGSFNFGTSGGGGAHPTAGFTGYGSPGTFNFGTSSGGGGGGGGGSGTLHGTAGTNFGFSGTLPAGFGGGSMESAEMSSGSIQYTGGCKQQPQAPVNSQLRCSQYSGCRASCMSGYRFPNGETQLFITCQDGTWQVEGTEWDNIPSCEAVCLPSCQNNGICVMPNQCNCPENYSGPQCQFEKKPCLNYPPLPMNSRRTCSSTQCTITCMKGHQFPDGSAITNMICKDATWVPSRADWVTIPNCQATCSPACENGGNCLSLNVCQCPQEYRGPQCQYRADACSAKKLQFNGGYNCSGDADTFSCSISCPQGVDFEFTPAAVYQCTYATGMFTPGPVPQCAYASNMQIIPINGAGMETFYETVNNNKLNMDNIPASFTVNNNPATSTWPSNLGHSLNMTTINGVKTGTWPSNKPVSMIENLLPQPGTCFTWGGAHYKTFDGQVFSFESECAHTLVRDNVDNTFTVVVQNTADCSARSNGDVGNCYRLVKIYLQDKEYTLKRSENSGQPILTSGKRRLPVPTQVPGLRADMHAHYVVVTLDSVGLTVRWDGDQLVQVQLTEAMWNRTEGLCGLMDGHADNDMQSKDGSKPKNVVTLAVSWQVSSLDDTCDTAPTEQHQCTVDVKTKQAELFCKRVLSDKRFAACHSSMDVSVLLNACKWDYCACDLQDPTECACNTMNVYVRECKHRGVTGELVKWRDEQTCPLKCTGGRVYMTCGPNGGAQAACGAASSLADTDEASSDTGAGTGCEEGCYCPQGTVLHEGRCITRDKCPCRLRGKTFAPGETVPKECNTCTCVDGQWVCTQVSCGARCSAIGDPHYQTFDGQRYDFMGQCSYYLIKTDNYTVEAENVACAGSISQAMNYPVNIAAGLPSCTKSVTVRTSDGHIIKLKQNREVSVNNQEVTTQLPYNIGDASLRIVSSTFIVLELDNGLEVWWDGMTRVYIDVPASFKHGTRGLCGTFNTNQKDDFLTPEGDVEQSVIPFANKWKTDERCADIPTDNDVQQHPRSHPCQVNVHNKAQADLHCAKLKSEIFSTCHWHVDPEPFYQDCLYDMCACETKVARCLCPIVSAYAKECADRGVVVPWMTEVRECGVHCPGGQVYQVCGDSCTRSCADMNANPTCTRHCVEGCNCPAGYTLDEHAECIPVGQCPCRHDGLEFPAGFKEMRPAAAAAAAAAATPGHGHSQLCTCANAIWNCRPAAQDEIGKYPVASDLKAVCSAAGNEEFTTCEPAEPTTCKNMHAPSLVSTAVCQPGCQCKKGYVLDAPSGKCVRPAQCPCHHGGRSYKDAAQVQNDCNTCTCEQGKWQCTDRICPAVCTVWGDSHYRTFDGRMYDYQGQCDYVLAKGSLSKQDSFDISVQNVPCSTLGVSCSRSVTIKVGQESVTLIRDRPVPELSADTYKRVTLRQTDTYVILEAADLGLTVHWDRGTRVYVRVDPRWKGHVKGLCGNYNDNQLDDFQTPSGGISEVSARLFGDSWRLQPYCPEAPDVLDTCEQRPDRKLWALKRCGVLKGPVFGACHTEVPVEPYLDRCVFDTCACDQGGDCECLCTALAAYAQECNMRGVPVQWRTRDLCPMQCDERCSNYSPCISTCPVETCENMMQVHQLGKLCAEDACVEGCTPRPCEPGQVYLNTSALECVPRATCKPICMDLDGVLYSEGDVMTEDACHKCYCTRNKKVCQGQPCSTAAPPVTHQHEQMLKCIPGWTHWINQDKQPVTKAKTKGGRPRGRNIDLEPVPSTLVLSALTEGGRCTADQMWDIQCRTVDGHIDHKATGLDVECSLERGLICKADKARRLPCPDFEIRVLCDCEQPVETGLATPPTPHESCDVSTPHKQHPADCHLFYHCEPSAEGPVLVEKSCGPHMMYNPKTQVCDWPATVMNVRPSCEQLEITKVITGKPKKKLKPKKPTDDANFISEEVIGCPSGLVHSPCAVECQRMCLFYTHWIQESGMCRTGDACEEGCIYETRQLSCPPGMLWRDNSTCVVAADCTCRAHDGTPIKPGTVHRESDCELCQCIENHYTCDRSACTEVIDLEPPVREEIGRIYAPESGAVAFIKSTVTPPEQCDDNKYILLVDGEWQPLHDQAFTASSVAGPKYMPAHSRLSSKPTDKSAGTWSPDKDDKNQYLQIDLGREEPVYGVVLKGNPVFDEYVTSYHVLHSTDGKKFNYIMSRANMPQLFRGPIDQHTPVRQLFDVPVETRVLRINPQSWHQGISVRADVIGCGEPVTTTPEPPTTTPMSFVEVGEFIVTTPKTDVCTDPMGLEDGMLNDQQISVSSQASPDNSKKALRLESTSAWQPLTNTPNEWVKFDFLEPRTLTGLETKGGPGGWVSGYNVRYSHDDHHWNPILDDYSNEKMFLGNFDQHTAHNNTFERPVQARYMQIVPKKWTNNIQMRVEPHGCYEPYPEVEEIVSTTPAPTGVPGCNHCPGQEPVTSELTEAVCKCGETQWWDGENCVSRAQCPCMVGHIAYSVGTVYEKEDCMQCLCTLGGVSQCTPKQCDSCESGLRATVTATCGCVCKPCPVGQVLCPTSNICINTTSWCNGVVECPDDEINCLSTTTLLPTTIVSDSDMKKCPEVKCPPGYRVQKKKKMSRYEQLHSNLSPMFHMYGGRTGDWESSSAKGSSKGGRKTGTNTGYLGSKVLPRKPISQALLDAEKEPECPQFKCVTNKRVPDFIHTKRPCPAVECPPAYKVVYEPGNSQNPVLCPRYECQPPPVQDAVCNVTGRTFNTFDGTEFKYDICNHVLARDLYADDWDISLLKNCTNTCSRDLIIRHGEQLVKMFPDLSIEFNGYRYSVEQTKKIGAMHRSFIVSRLGSTLLFVSNHYGFWVMWDKQGNVKVGVTSKLSGQVDGLCGFYDKNSINDKRKPDGKQARTSVEFGDSWALGDQRVCETRACPLNIQNQAWKMCNNVKKQILAPCHSVLDLDGWVSRCLETACHCLETSADDPAAEDECRCRILEDFVVECTTARPGVDLEDWRMKLECPASCPVPLVHHDCYRRRCEPTCANLAEPDACPTLPNICFPGCYCPAGLVRKKDKCVPPRQCRDCECNVLPHLQYMTFDGANHTADTNCTYLMAQDTVSKHGKDHQFQVYVSNAPCQLNAGKMCPAMITLVYGGHLVQVQRALKQGEQLEVLIDSGDVLKLPYTNNGTEITRLPARHINIVVPKIQLELRVYYPTLGASLRLPSHTYGGKVEGLCGDCNREPENDNRAPSGKYIKDSAEFVQSWLADEVAGTQLANEHCTEPPTKECDEVTDVCLALLDVERFGQCHMLLDPALFLATCRHDTCGGTPELACSSLETYALGCRAQGLCVDWHSSLCPAKQCPPGTEYKLCGPSCPRSCDQPDGCSSKMPTEGCHCPEGKLLKNNTCVEVRVCEACDQDGHYPGDSWTKDACTACRCDEKTRAVQCETRQCPAVETVCEQGYQVVKVPRGKDECCDKYLCMSAPTVGPTCDEPQPLTCGFGQVMKLDKRFDGCQQFVCQCKPADECDPVDQVTPEPLEPGMERVIDKSGCCPIVELVCRPEQCPPPKDCPKFYLSAKQQVAGQCCATYTCEPPMDKCLYEKKFTASNKGGERELSQLEKELIAMESNSTWSDGPCRECTCVPNTSPDSIQPPQPSCTLTECASMHESLDNLEYTLEEEWIRNQCCPNIRRAACKHEGVTYQVGDTWLLDNDPCTSVECVDTPAGVSKRTRVQTCDKHCDLGAVYQDPSAESGECCGTCKQVQCVVDGEVKEVGEEWTSTNFCTKYSCLNVNGSLQVQSVVISCPTISDELKADFVFTYTPIFGECCGKHAASACKVGDTEYEEGADWPDPAGDPCVTVSCVRTKGGASDSLVQQTIIQTCNTECPLGWAYQEPNLNTKNKQQHSQHQHPQCCGECVQIACVVNGTVYKVDDVWQSPDGCTTYECNQQSDGTLSVSGSQETCMDVSQCPVEEIYQDGCCKVCNITSRPMLSECRPVEMAAQETVHMIHQKHQLHGECKNLSPLDGFTECRGTCSSSTLYNPKTGIHESECFCCQANKYTGLQVELTCSDGFKFKKQIAIPSQCGCEGCAAAASPVKRPPATKS